MEQLALEVEQTAQQIANRVARMQQQLGRMEKEAMAGAEAEAGTAD